MTNQQKMMLGGVVAVVCLLVLGALLGRACSHGPAVVIEPVGIDAGPGDRVIAQELDAAIQVDEEAIHQLEERNARALEQFNEQQAAEYADVRRQGRHAVAAWLSDFNTQLKTDAGP
jgi:hypothetical protein